MLSNLYNQTYTIINQIPTSAENAKKCAWVKHILKGCDRIGGIYDKTQGVMTLSSETFTVYCKEWQTYKPPAWLDGGYYALTDVEKAEYFTVAKGDLIIFGEVDDPAPADGDGYDALIEKYSLNGGTVNDVQVFVNYKADGTPWQTNHIEIIKR